MRRQAEIMTAVWAVLLLGGRSEAGPPWWQTTPVKQAAKEIDRLQREMETVGSIVLKAPDVWGEERLTEHRREFETSMVAERDKFITTIQGYDNVASRTQVSISGAVTGPGASTVSPPTPKESKLDASAFARPTPTLEPSLVLEQKARYLGHLQALRRINEGDDAADSPGYSLYLVRALVNVLPGAQTQCQHGAEITCKASIAPDAALLPMTFRNLVVNDLVEQLTFPLLQVLQRLQDEPAMAACVSLMKELSVRPSLTDAFAGETDGISETAVVAELRELVDVLLRSDHAAANGKFTKDDLQKLKQSLDTMAPQSLSNRPGQLRLMAGSDLLPPHADMPQMQEFVQKEIVGQAIESLLQLSQTGASAARSRHARLPFPVSQIPMVFGKSFVLQVVGQCHANLASHRQAVGQPIKHHEVWTYLQDELQSAYDLLWAPENAGLWELAGPELVRAVRTGDTASLQQIRGEFRRRYADLRAHANSVTRVFVWGVLVESALLTDRLRADVVRLNVRGPQLLAQWPAFCLPDPSAEARQIFQEYLAARWPLRVFTLDPLTQDQNVLEQQNTMREMQWAAAAAFTAGLVKANALTSLLQQMQQELATLAVHRTVVGFASGADVFGWRFYPRMQVQSRRGSWLGEAFRTVFLGGATGNDYVYDRLEPGVRECVALILMPAFAPTVQIEWNARWFRLDRPDRSTPASPTTTSWIQQVETLGCDLNRLIEANCEPAATQFLRQKLEGLAARLPTQSLELTVPFQSTLGGFEIFTMGASDLGPELYSWHGATGINPGRPTTLFLTGHHFSVQGTAVVAEGRKIPDEDVRLLSRRVLQVTLPEDLLLDHPGKDIVLHVATPYGVSQPLLVPRARFLVAPTAK